jgi:RNA polymerase primary sigma factor
VGEGPEVIVDVDQEQANNSDGSDEGHSTNSEVKESPDIEDVMAVSALRRFLDQAAEKKLLTAEQEVALAKRVEQGDLGALNELVERNILLVVSIARKYYSKVHEEEDLIQQGMLGLVRAAELFDYRPGYRFSSYAINWIRQSIRRFIAYDRSIHMGQGDADKLNKIIKTRKELRSKLGREPSTGEIASALGLEAEEVQYMLAASSSVSLYRPVNEDGDTLLVDRLQGERSPNDSEIVDHVGNNALVNEWLDGLSERSKYVIEERYGLVDGKPKTLNQIAQKLGLSKERIRQIERAAEDTIRKIEANRPKPSIN